MTNTISFETPELRRGVLAVVPRIDDVPLPDLIERFDKRRGYTDPAGGYGGLVPAWFRYGDLKQYFLGLNEGVWEPSPGKLAVLGCRCGEVGCWPLACIIEASGDEVAWRSFEQPYSKRRDYSDLGPFIFGRSAYESALRSIPDRFD